MPIEADRRPTALPGGPELDGDGDGVRVRDGVVGAYRRHVNRGHARLAQFLGLPVETRADGVYVTAGDGRTYLDCGGYGVFLLGHRHPAVVAAVRRQLDRQPLSTRLFLNDRLAEAATHLAAVAPVGLDTVTFANSGTEAVEFALKLGRASGRRRLIAATGAFHGKTLGALSVMGRPRYRDPFLPLLPQVEYVPFGDAAALACCLAQGEPAAVILEPVQAEGGVRLPPPGYLRAVREVTSRWGALLIVDEIQTGLGRLGAWWAVADEGVVPDVLLTGKTLGGGVMPVAAAISSEEAYAPLNDEPLLHSSTFAGNQLAAAAVCATLQTLEEQALVSRAARLGKRLLSVVRGAVDMAGSHIVTDVRGRGLLVGIELVTDHHAAMLFEELLDEQIIVSYSLNADSVIRLTPPVLFDDNHLDRLGVALSRSLRRLR